MRTSLNEKYDASNSSINKALADYSSDYSDRIAIDDKKLTLSSISSDLIKLFGDPKNCRCISGLLSSNISKLQENFLSALCRLLREASIDLDHKLSLGLDCNAHLLVMREHPDKEKVQALLTADQEFNTIFAEIASQSTLLRNLSSIIYLSSCAEMGYDFSRIALEPYILCLKGDMSHFFFTN